MANRWIIPFAVDLLNGAPALQQAAQGLMLPHDHEAHTIEVAVFSGREPAAMTGTPMGYFERADGQTVAVAGTLAGNVVRVTLVEACYAVPGPLRCVIRLLSDVENERGMSLVEAQFYVREGTGDSMVDPGEAFPTVQALAGQLAQQVSTIDGRLDALEDAPALIQELSLAAGWENYATDIAPRVVRKGSACFLQGRIKNTAAITLNATSPVTIATLPSWARPAIRVGFVEQGATSNVFFLEVLEGGELTLSSYRTTTSFSSIAVGTIFNISAAWLAGDATGAAVDDLEALIARMEAVGAGAVRFDVPQSLTDEQKAQARGNIAAITAVDSGSGLTIKV